MRLAFVFSLGFVILSCSSIRQSLGPDEFKDPLFWKYDQKIREHFKIAFELYRYDMIAWVSSDSVSARIDKDTTLKEKLGVEWFCYLDNADKYHAVYGKYFPEKDKFQAAFHYEYDDKWFIRTSQKPIDSSLCLAYARAIHKSYPIVDKFIKEEKLKLNWYVIKDSLGRIQVWYLPSQLTDEYEVYGGDYSYVFDAQGQKLLDSAWHSNGFKIVKPRSQDKIRIWNEANEYPTVDNIFCALNILRKYKTKTPPVTILSKNYLSGLAYDNKEGYSWIHSKRKSK